MNSMRSRERNRRRGRAIMAIKRRCGTCIAKRSCRNILAHLSTFTVAIIIIHTQARRKKRHKDVRRRRVGIGRQLWKEKGEHQPEYHESLINNQRDTEMKQKEREQRITE